MVAFVGSILDGLYCLAYFCRRFILEKWHVVSSKWAAFSILRLFVRWAHSDDIPSRVTAPATSGAALLRNR